MYNKVGLPTKTIKTSKEDQVMKLDTDSLAHTRWNCKYHIVFAPKYRRQIIYGKIKADIGMMLRKLCEYKGVEILEAEACKDHIHIALHDLDVPWRPATLNREQDESCDKVIPIPRLTFTATLRREPSTPIPISFLNLSRSLSLR